MLAEISETDATGEIAHIFEEIRQLGGVPYVSAIYRHLATRNGLLEWAWEAVGPAFRNGSAQEAAWRGATNLALAPLDRISQDALSVWSVDNEALATVKAVTESFMRVSPVNMMFAGLVKALLEGRSRGGGSMPAAPWLPPASLPVPPSMVAPEGLDQASHGVLMQFSQPTGATPFVPGLYRMLAHWPGLLAHLATVLVPRLASTEVTAACDHIRARIDATLPDVLAGLPATQPMRPFPAQAERTHFLSIGGTYRKTSPELVVLCRLIRDALP